MDNLEELVLAHSKARHVRFAKTPARFSRHPDLEKPGEGEPLPLLIAVLLIPLLTYPLIYYLVPWQHRYRFPIEWILFLLAGAALWSLSGRRDARSDAASDPSSG